jgi:hypothetical protein
LSRAYGEASGNVRSSWASRPGSASASIWVIFPPVTVKAMTENGCPGGATTAPAAMRLLPDLVFRIKRQLAIVLLTEVLADGIRLDFACGDEVYGSCIQLQECLEACGQAWPARPATRAGWYPASYPRSQPRAV